MKALKIFNDTDLDDDESPGSILNMAARKAVGGGLSGATAGVLQVAKRTLLYPEWSLACASEKEAKFH